MGRTGAVMKYSHEPLSQRSSSDLSSDTLLEKESYTPQTPRQTFWRRWASFLGLQGALILVYTLIGFVIVQSIRQQLLMADREDSPAWSVMEKVNKYFEVSVDSVETWFGEPSKAVDLRWKEIAKYSNFKFSAEEMTRWDRLDEGVKLTDGSGYMGTLNVFHEMHCLQRIYMYLNKDVYYGDLNLTKYEENMNLHHTLHCLDALRHSTQCRIDISPVTYWWGPMQRLPRANWTSPHQCRNWDTFMDWAKENSFDPYASPGLVVHPKFGDAFAKADGNTRRLGIELKMKDGKVLEEGGVES